MTRKLDLDRLAGGADTAAFAEAVRKGNPAAVSHDNFTATGGEKQTAPTHALGAERFTASGDNKPVAGNRPDLGGADFTASGSRKVP